jgi:hypothetical protein
VQLLLVVGLAALGLLAVYAGYIVTRIENPKLLEQSFWNPDVFPRETSLPWGLRGRGVPIAVPVAALLVIVGGVLSLALARGSRLRQRARRAWAHGALWTVIGILMSVSPVVSWYGQRITLPHSQLGGWLPIYDILRAPNRLGVAALMGLAVLAGVAFSECTKRLHSRGEMWAVGKLVRLALAVLIATAMYAEYSAAIPEPVRRGITGVPVKPLPRFYPLAKVMTPDSPLMPVLRRSAGPLLELPVAHGSRGARAAILHADAMYRSIFHWRPLLNGYSGYWPADFPRRMALAKRLPHPAALAALREETGLEQILVHTGRLARIGRHRWLRVAGDTERNDLRLVARSGGDLLFEVR